MKLKTNSIILLVTIILASCSTNITNWEKKKLKWSKLPINVQKAMIDAIGNVAKFNDLTIYEGAIPEITSLDPGISVRYEWINSGGGTGYHRLIIDEEKYDLHSPSSGNKQNAPFVLYNHKLYYVVTLNVDHDSELESAEFGSFDFKNKY